MLLQRQEHIFGTLCKQMPKKTHLLEENDLKNVSLFAANDIGYEAMLEVSDKRRKKW